MLLSKMTACILLTAVCLCITLLLPLGTTEVTYYIKSTAESPCLENCLTLQEYAANTSRYFTPNTTLRFLPGEHVLNDTIVTLENFETLSFLGNNASTLDTVNTHKILCIGTSAIALKNIVTVTFRALTINLCGSLNNSQNLTGFASNHGKNLPAISVQMVKSFCLISCRMSQNRQPLSARASSITVHDTEFIDNKGSQGGAIFAQESTIIFTGRNLLAGNRAFESGGGVFADNTTLEFHGNTDFVSNSALGRYGGGMCCHSSYVIFGERSRTTNISSESGLIVFYNNSAQESGGGVYTRLGRFMSNRGWILNFTRNLGKDDQGGGIMIDNVSIVLNGSTYFSYNSAYFCGGAVSIWSSSWFSTTVVAVGNIARLGGAILSGSSKLHFGSCSSSSMMPFRHLTIPCSQNGNNCSNVTTCQSIFQNNVAGDGSAIAIYFNSTVTFKGTTVFQNNKAKHSGSISIENGELYVYDYVLFENNTSTWRSGGAIESFRAKIRFKSETLLIKNCAEAYGGGVFAMSSSISFLGNTSFAYNQAVLGGGGLYVENTTLNISGTVRCTMNYASTNGGMLKAYADSVIHIIGNSTFEMNRAIILFGGAFSITRSKLSVSGYFNFTENWAGGGGAIHADEDSTLVLDGVSTIHGNVAQYSRHGGYGGGIYCLECKLVMRGKQKFSNNSAVFGGGLAIVRNNYRNFLLLSANTTLVFTDNIAQMYGGAIAVEDPPFAYCVALVSKRFPLYYERNCFIQVSNTVLTSRYPKEFQEVKISYKIFHKKLNARNISIIFQDNLAGGTGMILYGGGLEECAVNIVTSHSVTAIETIRGWKAFAALTDTSLQQIKSNNDNISSTPFKVCWCVSHKPDCKHSAINLNAYPGQGVSFSVVAVGQLNGVAPALIHANFVNPSKAWLKELEDLQPTAAHCTKLQYTVFSTNIGTENLSLYTEGQDCKERNHILSISIHFLRCPYAFVITDHANCACEPRLHKYTNSCSVDNQTISHTGSVWIGFDSRSQGLILHPHCPFDYCTSNTVSFTLNSTDRQCAHGRSGTLCGACKSGFSLNLGSSQCSSCSNLFLFLFIPFAIAGFFLVVFLFICKVTVAAGTTSGLIFYVNILAVNQSVFFRSVRSNILTVFIAWLNLDLGIETCLCNGLDTYTQTWLQFVFPIYIWMLVGTIALASYYSVTISKVIGPTNPVSVLATIFLLSYTKLLRTIIATFSFTTPEYPNNKIVTVWALDGNIGYLTGKHIPLFLAGLLAFLFLFLPYTLLLVFGQCIVTGSNQKLLSWVNNPKVRSFLDAYHAPYKNQHRYWTGLLLLLRTILFVISAVVDINSPRDPSVNLLAIAVACTAVLAWNVNTGSVFKKWYNNILESSFIVNLTILAVASYQAKVEGGNQAAVVYTSMSIAFVTFFTIIAYHMSQQISKSRHWRNYVRPKLVRYWKKLTHHRPVNELSTDIIETHTAVPPPVPTTFVELREPLLDSQN